MDTGTERTVANLVGSVERAWNEADGAAFAAPFTEDADFVNIRGEHVRTREAIANGHQGILNTIYKGSTVRYEVASVRRLAADVLVERRSLFTMVLVHAQDDWRIAAFHNTLMSEAEEML